MSEGSSKERKVIVITAVATLVVTIMALLATCVIGRDQIISFFHPKHEMVIVPNLEGLSISVAKTEIETNGFEIGTITEGYDYEVAYNAVCGQSIKPGIQVAYGTTINIVTSIGAKPISVGDHVYFDGGDIYISSIGTEGLKKTSSTDTGLLIITDSLTNHRYGVRYGNDPTRFGWVDESLIHQRTN